MHKKRFVLLMTMMVVASGLAFSTAQSDEPSAGTAGAVAPAGVFPIVETTEAITVMLPSNPGVEDFETNDFTLWLEEKTNLDLQFEIIPQASATEKLNIVLASGDYPDLFMSMNLGLPVQSVYGAQGAFYPLNDLIDEYGVEYKQLVSDYPQIADQVTLNDGMIYSLPGVNLCYHCQYRHKLYAYQPWLDALGVGIPTTTDELRELLRMIKTTDLNGNGEADEIPLSGSTNFPVYIGLMTPFIYNDDYSKSLIVEDGVITPVFAQPEWRQGLEYLRDLYAEGLINPQSFTQDWRGAQVLGSAETVVLGVIADLHPKGHVGNTDRWKEYVPIPPLEGPDGTRQAVFQAFRGTFPGSFVIAHDASNPAAIFRLGDLMLSFEATARNNLGVPGRDWEPAKPGQLGLNDEQALYTRFTVLQDVANDSWKQSGISARTPEFRLGNAYTDENGNPLSLETGVYERFLYEISKDVYAPYAFPAERQVPPLVFTDEVANEVTDLENTISNYMHTMTARFITDDVDLDSGWDNYLSTLQSIGLERYIELYQTAYDQKYR